MPATIKPTQDQIAERFKACGLPGVTQPMVSQLFQGITAINFQHALILASVLRCDPRDVRDDLPEFMLLAKFGLAGLDGNFASLKTPPVEQYWPFSFSPKAWSELSEDRQREIDGMIVHMIDATPQEKKRKRARPKRVVNAGPLDELQ